MLKNGDQQAISELTETAIIHLRRESGGTPDVIDLNIVNDMLVGIRNILRTANA